MKRVIQGTVLLLGVLMVLSGGWLALIALQLPAIPDLRRTVEARLQRRGDRYIPTAQLPAGLQQAIVSVEDARFYQHHGIDWIRVLGALWADLRQGAVVQGGSTITEQLVKNILLGGVDDTPVTKAQAVLLALDLERRYSKPDILELYLNGIYYGRGAIGIGAASEVYFGRTPVQLGALQQVFLAGVVQGPTFFDPERHCAAARRRINQVLNAELNTKVISPEGQRWLQLQPLEYQGGNCLPL